MDCYENLSKFVAGQKVRLVSYPEIEEEALVPDEQFIISNIGKVGVVKYSSTCYYHVEFPGSERAYLFEEYELEDASDVVIDDVSNV